MDSFSRIYGRWDAAKATYVVSSSTESLVASIINAGEFVGAVSAFLVSNRVGLRGGLFVSSAFVCVGAVFQLAGTKIGLLIAGRLIMGELYLF